MIKIFFFLLANNIKQPFHKEKLLRHTIRVWRYVCSHTNDKALRLAALCHDIGKPTTNCGADHGPVGANLLGKFIPTNNKLYEEVYILVKLHMEFSILLGAWSTPEEKTESRAKLAEVHDKRTLAKLWLLAKADAYGTEASYD